MSSFKDLRIVDNFYQTSLFFPMPTVLISTIAADGSTSLGPYSLVQPYYVAGKEYYAMLLNCRNSSNTAQHILRTGKCAGRSFAINSVQYDSTNDAWVLECWRTEDESLSQWFPNTDYPVRGLENAGQSNEYPGDEFVLLDIAMPAIYVQMAEQKLLTTAQELLADTAVERWQYSPEIDAKFMVENSRTINAGEYLLLSDADIIGQSAESVLVDSVTINEGESAIPTYKVTLRDRKKKTWTESQSPEQSSGKPVGSIQTQQDTPYVDLSGYVKRDEFNDLADRVTALEVESFFMLDTDGNVTLKASYNNLWVPGWLASGGIGSGSGGGGGGYGVEEITTNEDGTVDFHFTGGDVTTVDLNHEHPQYPKYVVCTQAEYDALTTKDGDTLYLIPATT